MQLVRIETEPRPGEAKTELMSVRADEQRDDPREVMGGEVLPRGRTAQSHFVVRMEMVLSQEDYLRFCEQMSALFPGDFHRR